MQAGDGITKKIVSVLERETELSSGRPITSITPQPESTDQQRILQREGLTVSQQLHKSGNILIESMERSMKSSGETFTAMEVVEAAKALAQTAQTQANLLKILKDL